MPDANVATVLWILSALFAIVVAGYAATIVIALLIERRHRARIREYEAAADKALEALARVERIQNDLSQSAMLLKSLPSELSHMFSTLADHVNSRGGLTVQAVEVHASHLENMSRLLADTLKQFTLDNAAATGHLTSRSSEMVAALSQRGRDLEGHLRDYGEQVVAATSALREAHNETKLQLVEAVDRLRALEGVPREIITARSTLHDLVDSTGAGLKETLQQAHETIQIVRARSEQLIEEVSRTGSRLTNEVSQRTADMSRQFAQDLAKVVDATQKSQQLLDHLELRRVSLTQEAYSVKKNLDTQFERNFAHLYLLTLATASTALRSAKRSDREEITATCAALVRRLEGLHLLPEAVKVNGNGHELRPNELLVTVVKALESLGEEEHRQPSAPTAEKEAVAN